MAKINHLFLVEDDPSLLEIAQYQLTAAGYQVTSFSKAEDALAAFKSCPPDLILSDLILAGKMNGDDLLRQIITEDKNLPFILMTANGSIESAVECVKAGAWDYLTKPFHWSDMLAHIEKALKYHQIHLDNQRLKRLVGSLEDFSAIIGTSRAMTDLKKQLPRLAESQAPVLIQGESGTGKELVARCLHLNSSRKEKVFLAVNCGAIVHGLAESELFGHTRGAFTGAHQNKKGYFEEADGGTLFLDEIAELSLDLQVKLLRALQEKEITPVGQTEPIPVNIRLIAATHVDLQNAVEQGDFREDLFYRISVLPLVCPALRERHGDMKELCEFLLHKMERTGCQLDDSLMQNLQTHDWPGNIRELENFLIRLTVLNPEVKVFTNQHIPAGTFNHQHNRSLPLEIPETGFDLELHMRRLVESALHKCDGNQSRAARMLGISRSALIYRMQKFAIK